YVMLSRRDRENIHLATSTDVRHWAEVTELHRPSRSWELLQIGNCGSPLETDEGWLVITHGVGPMRRYVLGAILLDLDDPRRVVGQLREPLLGPDGSEREGYVPNVVYSCGSMLNGRDLVLPYGMSDGAVGIAVVSVPDLLTALSVGLCARRPRSPRPHRRRPAGRRLRSVHGVGYEGTCPAPRRYPFASFPF